ncbi:MAG TPA: M1 family aminopeptidase [Ktedonosporobacter sp.]|nr:M1 family aminopeptidase [Ktedonosporobacter sp.]
MTHCKRGEATIDAGHNYSLLFFNGQHALPSPQARSFALPGDQLHYAPDRPADVRHVKLEIALDFEQETISGTAYTTFKTLYDTLTTISLDAIELNIEQVEIAGGGPKLDYTTTDKKLIITLDRPYNYKEVFTIAVKYHAKPRTGLHFMKPVPEDPTRPVHAWTFGQPTYHRYWFPCHDSPNDRATTEIIVTVPSQFLTVSNGNLLEVTDHGATKTHHWRHDVPHAAYLVSLVVGDFAVIEDSYKGKPVTYYVRPDRKDDAPLYMGKTPEMMRFFSEFTGVEYPYDKYAQTVVEVYTGAMEHTTATTHSFALLLDKKASLDVDLVPVVAHELAHQWFGDLVTCRDWSNGWLNEGFATYFDQLFREHDRGEDEFKYAMLLEKRGYLAEDSKYRRPIVYYVYHDQGFELFDAHLYNKGAWVLHMLRHLLGNETFKRGIRTYLERFRTKEVVTSDLERTIEEVSGRSLARFFQQWVHSGGHPDLAVDYTWDSERKLAKVKIKQTQTVDDLTPCFFMPLDLVFTVPISDRAAKDEQTTETLTVPLRVTLGEDGQVEQSFYIPLEREPLMVRVDPDGWLLKTLKFERCARMLRYQLAQDPDVLGRVEAAEALGEQKDDASVDALTSTLNNDAFWYVRSAAAGALAKIGSEKAQAALIQALQQLDPTAFSQVRAAVARALGTFQAPQRAEMAQRSAQALRSALKKGDVSYLVESASAEALGQTRTEGNVDFLVKLLDRPSWTNFVQAGIFRGLGQSGEDRVIDIMASYAANAENHPTLRRAAIVGLNTVGQNLHLYSEEARQRAVTALINAVEHDSWAPVRRMAAVGLAAFGEKRAISALESTATTELDDGITRSMRFSAHALRTGSKGDEQVKQLRKDLDDVREENRQLRDRLGSLEARLK